MVYRTPNFSSKQCTPARLVSAHLSSKLHLEYTYGQTTTTSTMSFKKDEESGGLCTSPFYAVDSADI